MVCRNIKLRKSLTSPRSKEVAHCDWDPSCLEEVSRSLLGPLVQVGGGQESEGCERELRIKVERWVPVNFSVSHCATFRRIMPYKVNNCLRLFGIGMMIIIRSAKKIRSVPCKENEGSILEEMTSIMTSISLLTTLDFDNLLTYLMSKFILIFCGSGQIFVLLNLSGYCSLYERFMEIYHLFFLWT